MVHHSSGSGSWRAFVVALGLLAVAFFVYALFACPRYLGPVQRSGLLFKSHPEQRFLSRRQIVDEVQPGSPLIAAGVKPGDVLELKGWRGLGIFESPKTRIDFALQTPQGSLPISVVTVPQTTPEYPAVFEDLTVASMTLGLAFGVLIGLRQPDSRACRFISVGFISTVFNAGVALGHQWSLEAFTCLSYTPSFIAPLLFAIYFQNEEGSGRRGRLVALVPWATGLLLVLSLVSLLDVFSFYIPERLLFGMGALIGIGLSALVVVALADGWRNSYGESRQRLLWMLVVFLVRLLAGSGSWLIRLLVPDYFIDYSTFNRFVQIVSYVAIAYAVLRYRAIDLGFVVSRGLVYSVTSLTVLVAFGVTEWGVEHVLHFESREKNVYLDGAIALAVYLMFHRVRHRFEHAVEALFFHRWHENEERLRAFVKQAPFVRDPDALIQLFGAAVARFAAGADVTIYRQASGKYFECALRVGPSAANSTPAVDVDDAALVAMRAQREPIARDDVDSAVPFDWALPMLLPGGELAGFVTLGNKPSGDAYRPDEIEALVFASQQIGLNLEALRVKQLETGLRQAQEEVALSRQLLAAVGQPMRSEAIDAA